MTLLLGPPGSGKTTLLLALAAKLDSELKVEGSVTYNGHAFNEFVPQRTSSSASKDLHVPELTVRETLDFSARCHGVGSRFGNGSGRSEEQHLHKVLYIMKILELNVFSNTIVGDNMRQGLSGCQKKRITTEVSLSATRSPSDTLCFFQTASSNGIFKRRHIPHVLSNGQEHCFRLLDK